MTAADFWKLGFKGKSWAAKEKKIKGL